VNPRQQARAIRLLESWIAMGRAAKLGTPLGILSVDNLLETTGRFLDGSDESDGPRLEVDECPQCRRPIVEHKDASPCHA
jgi:hypothetical protein